MKTCVSSARLAVLPLALAAAFPVFSQTSSGAQLRETVVTATRTAQPIGDVVADVTIIDRDTIERSGVVGIADLLARVPGIEIKRNGGVGNSTDVYIRGGDTKHTAVLIDGVRIDSQSTSGGVSWNAIPLSQIDRIEVVRGPSSAVYGSDAVAGVIQIFTKRGENGFFPAVNLGYGTHGTRRTDLSVSGAAGAVDYSFGVNEELSKGFNVRPIPGQNIDRDGYSSTSGNARVGLQFNSAHRLEASLLDSTTNAQYDSGLTRDYRLINKLRTESTQWLAQWSPQYQMKVALSRAADSSEDVIPATYARTRIETALWQNNFQFDRHALSAALEQRQDTFDYTGTPRVSRGKSQSATALGYGWSNTAHTIQLNARRDDDSEFGSKGTGSAAYAFALTPQWRVSASTGTAFRVPTLYQRFTIYGTPTLRPELGHSTELGLRYSQGSTQFGVTAYRNRVSDLLNFQTGSGPCPNGALTVALASRGCYVNIARAQYKGITFTAAHKLGVVNVRGSLDVQNPKDLDTGRQLPRRARQHGTLGGDFYAGTWLLGLDAQFSGKRFDTATANSVVLGGYTLINLHASTALARDWSLVLRLDNVSDKDYATAAGYKTAGQTGYVGVKWAPR